MANNEPMSEGEVETAFQEAERFIKLFDAFVVVRDRARQHVKMKQEMVAMERRKAEINGMVARAQDALRQLEADHVSRLGQLDSDFKDKSLQNLKAHDEQATEFRKAIQDLEKRRRDAEKATEAVESASRQRIKELDQSVADTEKQAELSIADINNKIAAKEGELRRVQASFDAFVTAHNLR